jgi:hypothetical protein
MQKENIDYSNTIIYKIYCKDESIKDIYVGHTTNFIQRKAGHKSACNNEKNDVKIYKIIRKNGGWNNWKMIEIANYNCKNFTEARIKENEHFKELKSTLNSCPPYVDKIIYFCSICNLQYNTPKQYETHIKSVKHNNLIVSKENNINNEEQHNDIQKKYKCNCCNITTNNRKDYEKHILTFKHKNKCLVNVELNKNTQNFKSEQTNFNCEVCDKIFKSRVGLWKHKKTCILDNKSQFTNVANKTTNEVNNTTNENTTCIITTDIFMELIKDNKEMKQIILDQNNTINNLKNLLHIK